MNQLIRFYFIKNFEPHIKIYWLTSKEIVISMNIF